MTGYDFYSHQWRIFSERGCNRRMCGLGVYNGPEETAIDIPVRRRAKVISVKDDFRKKLEAFAIKRNAQN